MKLVKQNRKIDFIFDVESNLTIEEQKALSMGAMLSWKNGNPINTLSISEIPDVNKTKDFFYKWWRISNHCDAIETLNWLVNGGHREGFKREMYFNDEDYTREFKKYALINDKHDISSPVIDAWDYGRIVYVAKLAHALGYITSDEAWKYIMLGYQKTKDTFRTWTEFAKSYILGRYVWGEIESVDFYMNMSLIDMLIYEESTWNKYPLHEEYRELHIAEKDKFLKANKKNIKTLNKKDGLGFVDSLFVILERLLSNK